MAIDIKMLHNKVVEAAKSGKPLDLAALFGFPSNTDTKEDHSFPNMYPESNLSEAARMKWSVTPSFKDANHYPIVSGAINITAKAGDIVQLNATVSDPDGDKVAIKWWYFPVGTYQGKAVTVNNAENAKTNFKVPADAKLGNTIHLVLQAKDNGTPSLTKYLRTIITVF